VDYRGGAYTEWTEYQTVAVETDSTHVLDENPSRKWALFINDSDTTIYLAFGQAQAYTGRGIRLNANGGSYEMSRQDGNLWAGHIDAIHGSTGTKSLLVMEAE